MVATRMANNFICIQTNIWNKNNLIIFINLNILCLDYEKMCPFIARFRAVESHYHPLNHIFHAFGGMSCFFLLIMNRLGWNIWKMSILAVQKTQYFSKKYNWYHKIGWTHHPEFTNLIFRHKNILKSLPKFERNMQFDSPFEKLSDNLWTTIAS